MSKKSQLNAMLYLESKEKGWISTKKTDDSTEYSFWHISVRGDYDTPRQFRQIGDSVIFSHSNVELPKLFKENREAPKEGKVDEISNTKERCSPGR